MTNREYDALPLEQKRSIESLHMAPFEERLRVAKLPENEWKAHPETSGLCDVCRGSGALRNMNTMNIEHCWNCDGSGNEPVSTAETQNSLRSA